MANMTDRAHNVTLRHVGSFDFVVLFDFLQEALKNTTDPPSSPYFQFQPQGNYISLTNDVCLNVTGSTRGTFAVYDNQGIWNRIVTWKLPLVALLFQFARPPFAFRLLTNTNVFIIMRLVGNPIGTIASLLFTAHRCQGRVNELRGHIVGIRHELTVSNHPNLARRISKQQSHLWKVFALLCISYDEWKVTSMDFLTASLTRILHDPSATQSKAALKHFENAAFLLAADRSTYILPIFIAQMVFVSSLGAAFWRIIGVPPGPQSWTNIEAYSIAMSAPFLAILPAVFLSALVGASQTETSVPRILNDLGEKLKSENWGESVPRICVSESTTGRELGVESNAEISHKEPELSLSERITNGAIYAWQPEMLSLEQLPQTWPLIAIASAFVSFSIFVAGWISYRIPPEGFDCRNTAQMALFSVWILAVGLDLLFIIFMERYGHLKSGRGHWYEVMFVKDSVVATASITLVMVTQFGIFNRCDCYTLWGRVPLALPQIPEVTAALMDRIALEWPLVTFSWILIEVMMCMAIWWWWYKDAFRVYTQKDDGTSNLDWIPTWLSSVYRLVFRKTLRHEGSIQTLHGIEPGSSEPDIPLLDGPRLSGEASSKSAPAAGRSSGRKGDLFDQIGPTAGEWASTANSELMNLRRRAT